MKTSSHFAELTAIKLALEYACDKKTEYLVIYTGSLGSINSPRKYYIHNLLSWQNNLDTGSFRC